MIRYYITALVTTLIFILSTPNIFSKFHLDLSQNKLNTISSDSLQLLNNIESEMQIEVLSTNIDRLNAAKILLNSYQHKNLKIIYRNHTSEQDAYNFKVVYKNKAHRTNINLHKISEEIVSEIIQTVLNKDKNWIALLQGHGEHNPQDQSEHGLSMFIEMIKKLGYNFSTLDLKQTKVIPDNTKVLIVANPQVDFLNLEQQQIFKFISSGGNIVWLTEPGSTVADFLLSYFGLEISSQVLIDNESVKLGSPHPAITILTKYTDHPITNNMNIATMLPWSAVFNIKHMNTDFKAEYILDKKIGVALQNKMQHHAFLGNSSFITNKYLKIYGNSILAAKIISWANADNQSFVYMPPKPRDQFFQPNNLERIIILFLLPFGMPVAILLSRRFFIQRSS